MKDTHPIFVGCVGTSLLLLKNSNIDTSSLIREYIGDIKAQTEKVDPALELANFRRSIKGGQLVFFNLPDSKLW